MGIVWHAIYPWIRTVNLLAVSVTQSEKKQNKNRTQQKKILAPAPKLAMDEKALKDLHLVAVAYSQVEREWFSTDEAYQAELEVVDRAESVVKEIEALGIAARAYAGDQYFLSALMIDRPDLVLNLVDTLRGKDSLQSSVLGALELAGIPYTGAGIQGLVIGNDRNMVKQMLRSANIPTPDFQYITRKNTGVNPDLGVPLIVKLIEGGGGVGIDADAVKETVEEAQKRVEELISTYHMPVIVEKFIDGLEIASVVLDDGNSRHVFLGQKAFRRKPDGKHYFTNIESYSEFKPYSFEPVQDASLQRKIDEYSIRAFTTLKNKDYSKFDIRVDEKTGTPYFTDCNPNTAFGPQMGLPLTEILSTVYGVEFRTVLKSLLSKYAKKISANH